jgi:transposase
MAAKIIIVLGLVTAISILYLNGKSMRAQRDLAVSRVAAVEEANESLKLSLDAERMQREMVEQALLQRAEDQKEFEAKQAEVLKQRNWALSELRKANEKIDEYRSLSIPYEFFDFVRQQAAGGPD